MNVDIDNLVVEYSGIRALDGATCSFHPGCVNGLIGPNGAGKSTLLNAVSGAVRPVSGRVTAGGDDVTGRAPERMRERRVARTFQVPRLQTGLSVVDNVVIGLPRPAFSVRPWLPWRASAPLRERRAQAEEWLDRFGAPALGRTRVADLTLPEQRVVELVRALAGKPALVMLDEPSSGLGIREAARILRRGLELLPDDATIVLVSHDVELVFEFASWIVVMSEGRVLAQGEPDGIKSDARVREAYLGVAA